MTRRTAGTTTVRLTACLLVSLVAVACGGGDDKGATTTGSSSTTVAGAGTTTSAPVDTSSTTVAGPVTTARRAPVTTAAPDTAPPATDPPGPVALTPPAPGTYRYATSGSATVTGAPFPLNFTYPPVSTNVVDPPAGTRQHSQRRLVDASGNGSVIDFTFDYRSDGVYLESLRLTTTFNGNADVQDLTPPVPLLFLATGAAPGATQTLDIPAGGGSAQVVVHVTAIERVTVGSQGLDTLVIRAAVTLPAGTVTGTQTLTVNLDPASRLWVREKGVADGTAVVGLLTLGVHTDYAATIESVTPG
ncbi:MAG: hypothetical protein QOI99_403 [Actinomycetota bacterium]|nr:hypothetical protein [Actinomycetota bacterium]